MVWDGRAALGAIADLHLLSFVVRTALATAGVTVSSFWDGHEWVVPEGLRGRKLGEFEGVA
jgi:hypothetical protein